MALTPLTAGYNVIINQKVGSTNTPIYPFTRTANIKDTAGNTLDELLAGKAAVEHGNHVPDFTAETANNLRFLRNDNTWATIQSASTSQAGVVQLSSATNVDDATLAATASAVKSVQDAVDTISGNMSNYVLQTQIGAAGDGSTKGVAELDSTGKVPAAQLPSFVDDVIEVGIDEAVPNKAYDASGAEVTPETGKIYVDAIDIAASGSIAAHTATNKVYRWSGSLFAVISETLALGETSTTAYRGDRGKIAYDHSQADHARVDATKTEASESNGYIKINGSETLVYTHPSVSGATETNPHGTTKSDVGLGNVENKSSETIRSEITSSNVTTALGYTPQDASVLATASNNGVMSSTYAAKLDECQAIAVNGTEPTFASGNGIWFQVVSTDSAG